MANASDDLDLDIRISSVHVPVTGTTTPPEPEPDDSPLPSGTCVSLVCTGSGNLCEADEPGEPEE